MYNSSNLSKFKSQRNVCRIDLNDITDRQKQANTPTVSKKISNFSPVNNNLIKNSSSFHTLLSQLQPSTTKNPKNYSQQKQMLITKKNEIIKNAIKQSLSTKKPGTPQLGDNQENWEYSLTKASDKYAKENEVPSEGGIRSREKMDQFYYNMRHARPSSVAKQHNVDRGVGIASFISPKNKSYMQKAVIPNSTVNLSGISNNETKTANTTIIKYNPDYKDNNSYIKEKGRSFDLKHDASPSNKYPAQNRILLDLDESLNLAPLDQVKTSNTTAHARYSKSREEIQNILASNIHYQPLNISGFSNRQPPVNLPCKIIKETETFEKPAQKDSSPEKDLFELNMSPIKSSNNRNLNVTNTSDMNVKDSQRNAKNLANQPYPTIIKQINLNSNTPTSVGKPPLHGYAQQADYYFAQEMQQKAGQEALKHKHLNIQTVKENKKIEFPSYLQNFTCDRQKPILDLGIGEKETQQGVFQPAMLNYIEKLSRNRNSNENSREYAADKAPIPEPHFRFPSHNEQANRRNASGHMHRLSYGEAPKKLDLSSHNLRALRHDSFVENTTKQILNSSAQLPNGRHLLDVGVKRINEILPDEIIPQSVKANTLNPERYLKEMNENLPNKENRVSQDQNQAPPLPVPKTPTNEVDRRQLLANEVNIMDLDPEEKEFRIKKFREEYVVGKQIGQGAYATVRIGLHKPTNTKVAIKIYEKVKIMDPMRRRSVRREIKLMQRMDHPSIIKILDVVETNNHMNIVMEYIGGTSLHSFLKAQPNRRLKEEHAYNIFKQIVAGLYYCHARCITHRDIKLENMLLDNHGNLKIIDFGFSTCIPNDKKVRMFCGTPSYMAPEIVTKVEYCGPPADIWALGVLLYALLSGTFPFRGENDKELYRKISKGEFMLPENISDKAASLITKMINVDPDQRLTAKEIMNEPWYVMHAFMEKKPDRRITSRSSSAAVADEKQENRMPLPMNINTGQPIIEQPFMPIANYLKSPPYNAQMNVFERPNMANAYQRDDDLSKEFMRHLSPNNFKSLSKHTPSAGYNQANNFYYDTRNLAYTTNLKENANGSYIGKDMTDVDIVAPDDNFDENRLKCKKTLSEIEIWNVPANISEKSYKRDSGKSSFIQPSNFQNRSFKRGEENANYDNEIFLNMMKMGYKEEEINQGLRERNGSAYAIFNRMQNEKKALNYSNYADSINSDQNNNNSFNLASNTGLKRKSLNLWVQKNPSQGNQGKENAYTPGLRPNKDGLLYQDDVLKPLSSNTNRKNVPW